MKEGRIFSEVTRAGRYRYTLFLEERNDDNERSKSIIFGGGGIRERWFVPLSKHPTI